MPKSYFSARLLTMITTSFNDWKKSREARSGSGAKQTAPRTQDRPLSFVGKYPTSTTGGVDSFNSMKRAEKGKEFRPPSEVGSVRSFRSIATTEEQIEGMEQRLNKVEEGQNELSAKLDQILAVLSTSQATASAKAEPSSPAAKKPVFTRQVPQ